MLSPLNSSSCKDAYELLFLMLYVTQAQALTSPGLYRSLWDRGHVPACEIKPTSKEANYIYPTPCSDPSSPALRSSFAFGSCVPLTAPSDLTQLQHPPPHSSLGFFSPTTCFLPFLSFRMASLVRKLMDHPTSQVRLSLALEASPCQVPKWEN